MKNLKFFILMVLFVGSHSAWAQNCGESFYTSKQGTRLSFENYDDKNKFKFFIVD